MQSAEIAAEMGLATDIIPEMIGRESPISFPFLGGLTVNPPALTLAIDRVCDLPL